MYLVYKSYLPVVILPCWSYSTDYGINCSRKAFYTILKIKMMLHVIHAYSVSIGCTLQNVSLYFQTIPVFLDACRLKGMQWILWYGIWEKQMMALIISWRNEGLRHQVWLNSCSLLWWCLCIAGGLTRRSRKKNSPLKSNVSFFLLITKAARNEQCSKDNLSSKYQFLSRQKKSSGYSLPMTDEKEQKCLKLSSEFYEFSC